VRSGVKSAPGRTRTCDPRLRRPVLYPTELRAHMTASVAGLSAVAPPPRGEEAGALSPAHRGGLRVVSGPDRGLTQGADPAGRRARAPQRRARHAQGIAGPRFDVATRPVGSLRPRTVVAPERSKCHRVQCHHLGARWRSVRLLDSGLAIEAPMPLGNEAAALVKKDLCSVRRADRIPVVAFRACQLCQATVGPHPQLLKRGFPRRVLTTAEHDLLSEGGCRE
jgi:hypothetical protein